MKLIKDLNPKSSDIGSGETTLTETHEESLELNIKNPGHEFNDKEILDKNADA